MTRVLLVADVSAESQCSGIARMLAQHAHALHRTGVQCSILSRQPESGAPMKVTIMEGVEEYRLPYDGDQGWSGLTQLRHHARAWWKQHGSSFDLVVAEQPFVMLALQQAGCRLPYLQACYSFAYEEYAARNGPDWHWRHSRVTAAIRRLEAGLYRRAARLFVLSDYSRRRLDDAFGITDGIDVGSTGVYPVDDTLFLARQSLRAELGWHGPVAVTVQNLIPSAGVDLLVQVAAICRYSQPDLRWVVMGEGPLLEPLQRLAKEIGVEDRIEYTGLITDDDVKKRLIAADLFLQSTRALEGFELATAKANACGLPVVATPVGANVEMIQSLPSPNRLAMDVTPEALALAVDELLEEKANLDYEDMRLRLRTEALQYDWSHHDACFLQCVQEIGA